MEDILMDGASTVLEQDEILDENLDAQYTAYVIFNKHNLLTHSMDNLAKLEAWLLAKLGEYTSSFGLIMDNKCGKVVAKHKRSSVE